MERGYSLYMKIVIVFGVPLLATMTVVVTYAYILGFLPENGYFPGFLMLPIPVFFGYGTFIGILILRDINIIIIPTDDGLIVRRRKSSRRYIWSDLWKFKNSKVWQIFKCIDKRGKIIFVIDYEYIGIEELITALNRKFRINYWGDLIEKKY